MLLRSELHGCLARIESFLVRAGAALGTSLVAPKTTTPVGLNLCSPAVGDEGLYCCLSPRAGSSLQLEPYVPAASGSESLLRSGLM
jgi:hypothetical protein